MSVFKERYLQRPEPAMLRWLGQIIDWLIVVAGTGILLIVMGNVISRIGGHDVAWANELSVFLMVWSVFLGCASATRRGIHLRVWELIDWAAHGRLRLALEFVITVAVIAVLGQMAWYGYLVALNNMDQDMTVLYWPVGLMYSAMPVGAALMGIYCIRDLAWLVREFRNTTAGAP